MLKEFKEFIAKGNLIDLAVAVILGLAFAAVVNSLVDNVFTPIIAAIFGQPDFSSIKIDIGDSAIMIGSFLNDVISFLIIGFVLFLTVKSYNRFAKQQEEAPAAPSEEVVLLTQIRDELASRP